MPDTYVRRSASVAGANFCTGLYDMETTTEREMCGLPVFVYNRRYFGSSLGPLFSGLSPVLSMTYIVIRTKFRSRDVERSDVDPHIFPDWLRRNNLHVGGNSRIKTCGDVRGACTQSTQFAWCPITRLRCGTFERAQPGMAAGGGVVNPKETSTRAAGRAKSAPLASRSRIAAARAARDIAAAVRASTRALDTAHWTSQCNNNANPEAASRALVQFRQPGREPEPNSYASAPNSQSIVLLGTAAARGFAFGSGVVDPMTVATLAPPACRSDMVAASGVDNPRAAMAQDAGDEFSKALLKARFPGTEDEDREYEREEAADETGSGLANPMSVATPAPPACRSDMVAASGADDERIVKKKLSRHARAASSADKASDMARREEEDMARREEDDSSDSEDWEPRYEEIRRTRSTTSYLMHMAYRTQGSSSEPIDDQMWKSRNSRVGNPTVILAREREARGTPQMLGVIPEHTQPRYATAVEYHGRLLEDWEARSSSIRPGKKWA